MLRDGISAGIDYYYNTYDIIENFEENSDIQGLFSESHEGGNSTFWGRNGVSAISEEDYTQQFNNFFDNSIEIGTPRGIEITEWNINWDTTKKKALLTQAYESVPNPDSMFQAQEIVLDDGGYDETSIGWNCFYNGIVQFENEYCFNITLRCAPNGGGTVGWVTYYISNDLSKGWRSDLMDSMSLETDFFVEFRNKDT